MRAKNIRLIHQGDYLSYYEIDYMTENGLKTYEMVSKTGSKFNETGALGLYNIGTTAQAIVLLVFNKEHTKMLLLKEFRLGVNQWVVNNVAGLVDSGETNFRAAERELKEETGLGITKFIAVLEPTFTCAPVTDDLTTLIICEADGEFEKSTSADEEIQADWYTKQEVSELLQSNMLKMSARTQALCYAWVYGIQ